MVNNRQPNTATTEAAGYPATHVHEREDTVPPVELETVNLKHLHCAKEMIKPLYLPADFIPLKRADGQLKLENVTDRHSQYWKLRHEEQERIVSVVDTDKLEAFRAQVSMRKEFRQLAENYITNAYVHEAIHKYKLKKLDGQIVVSFNDVVLTCENLYSKRGISEHEILANRRKVWELKYTNAWMSGTKWELVATEEILKEHNVTIRNNTRLIDGRKKCSFVKIVSVALVKIRTDRLCPKLTRRCPQDVITHVVNGVEIPITKVINGVERTTKKRRVQKKRDTKFDPMLHVHEVVDFTIDTGARKTIPVTVSGIMKKMAIHFKNGGTVDSFDDFQKIVEGTNTGGVSPRGVVEIDTFRVRNRSLPHAQSDDDTITDVCSRNTAGDNSSSVIGSGLRGNSTDEWNGVEDEMSEVMETDVTNDGTEGDEESVDDGDDENDEEKPCGNCNLTQEYEAYAFRKEQYWVHGLTCNDKNCKMGPYNEENITPGMALNVCKRTRVWRNKDLRVRECNVVYCGGCNLPGNQSAVSGRRTTSRRQAMVPV